MPYYIYICLSNRDGYLTEKNYEAAWQRKIISGVAQSCLHIYMTCALFLPGEMRLLKWCLSYYRIGTGLFSAQPQGHYSENQYSPTLYSQITGKYASVGSKIFPHILLLCSISYSCFNGLTINQHFIKPLQGEKCTSYLSVVDLSIVFPRVFFFAALCGRTNLRLRSRARTPTKLLRSTF